MKKIIIFISSTFVWLACTTSTSEDPNPTKNDIVATGWNGKDVPSKIPSFLGTFGEKSTTDNETKVDLGVYLPPIRSQNPYGTCVCWAVTHAKTILEAVGKNLTPTDLQNDANRMSPRDLWEGIDISLKDPQCQGTQISHAMGALQRRGVETWADVPYTGIGCSISAKPANPSSLKHKIRYYRKIEQSVPAIKASLRNKIPVVMAGLVNSTKWSSYAGQVMADKSWIGTIQEGHAMTIVGFDDTKNAFKIANSWGSTWGQSGFAWMDYNFLVSQFVISGNLYIMGDENTTKVNTDFGVDLAPYVFSDASDAKTSGIANQRLLEFNIFNIGSKTAEPSSNWEFYYIYYNAFNANEYGVIFKDKFNTTVKANSYGCVSSTDCSFNYPIAGGNDFAYQVFKQNSIKRTYKMPTNLNGTYYLVLYADATSKVDEQNEQNNLFYTTGQDPITFTNGIAARTSSDREGFKFTNDKKLTSVSLKANEFNSAVNTKNANAYTPDEIISFIKAKKKSGELDKKVIEGSFSNPYSKN